MKAFFGYKLKAGFLSIFILISFQTFGQTLDYKIVNSIYQNRNQNLDPFFHGLSISTAWVCLAYPIGLESAALFRSDSALFVKGISAGIGLGASTLATYLAKETIKRKRPFKTHSNIIPPYEIPITSSFPSGHTSSAFETATHFSLTFRKWYYIVPAYTWASSVAWSRLHQGVHYPSDVLVGALVGSTFAWMSYKTNRWLGHKTVKVRRKFLKK